MKKDVQKELQLTNHLYRALDRNEMSWFISRN
jgi:hypothetical protein